MHTYPLAVKAHSRFILLGLCCFIPVQTQNVTSYRALHSSWTMDKTSVYDDQSVIHELSQSRSPSRKELFFKHVITEDKNESILNAYKVKNRIVKSTSKPSLTYRIDTSAPIVSAPEGKFNHNPGARISPITLTPSKLQVSLSFSQPWCSSIVHQIRISAVSRTTSFYKEDNELRGRPSARQACRREHLSGGDSKTAPGASWRRHHVRW